MWNFFGKALDYLLGDIAAFFPCACPQNLSLQGEVTQRTSERATDHIRLLQLLHTTPLAVPSAKDKDRSSGGSRCCPQSPAEHDSALISSTGTKPEAQYSLLTLVTPSLRPRAGEVSAACSAQQEARAEWWQSEADTVAG